mgnify:CR=1 FL=1
MSIFISVISTCYNEEENIFECYSKVKNLFEKNKADMVKLLNTTQEKLEMEMNKFTSTLVR